LVALKYLPGFNQFRFTLIVYPELLVEIKNDLGPNFSYITTTIKHYSLTEQIQFPFFLKSLKPDLVHFTHLDKPIFYFGRSVVTVHDLIRHFSKGGDTTTKNPLLYWPKYFGYLLMTMIILITIYIIVPSNFWRDYLINNYHFSKSKVTTTYEAVDPEFLHSTPNPSPLTPMPYLIYTGNLYPHKNINVIIEALKSLPDIKLKVICARSVFQKRIEKLISQNHLQKQVEFLGYLKDKDFQKLYSTALALVHPSFLEGFSLTGLEAMALNCPVISSNASCLPAIYGDSVLYFDPNDPKVLVAQINNLLTNPSLRQKLIKRGHKQVKKYSWITCATQTLTVYNSAICQK
jgi:glycosyltransferase involved in cell wall biosynthesis